MERPQFNGNPRNAEDLLAYERELRAWEEAKADAEHYDALYKAEPEMPLAEAIGRFLEDPQFRERFRGPEGMPGLGGPPGKQGPPGVGNEWLAGSGAPSSGLGSDGDFYLDTDNGDVYQKSGGAWALLTNIAGPTGPQGPQGDPGPAGADGATWTTGSGAPVGAGVTIGDLYLDTANGDVYQWDGAVWNLVTNITGPTGATGATGATGPAGADGNDWRVGSGAPSIVAGDEEGDLYLDTSNGDVYQVQSSAWVLVANIEGPQGPQGDPGEDISASYAQSIGPVSANQTIATGSGTTLDLDFSVHEEPAASWSVSTAGVWTWDGGEDATFLVLVRGMYIMLTNTGHISQSLQKNGSGSVLGSACARTFLVNEVAMLHSQAIVALSDGDTLEAKAVGTYATGASGELQRATGNITILRIK